MINDDLERLATRGPTRDPVGVVDAAMVEAATARGIRGRLATVVASVVLIAGLALALASMRDSGTPANVDPPLTVVPTSPSTPVAVPPTITDDSDINSPGVYPCGYSPTTTVRAWSSDTSEVSLIVKDNGAYLIRVTDDAGNVHQTCQDSTSAKAALEHEASTAWALPMDDGVFIVIMHPVGRQIIPIDELTHLGPAAAVGSSDWDLSIYLASPDGELPAGNPSLDNLARIIQEASNGPTDVTPLASNILVPETDDDFATSETFTSTTTFTQEMKAFGEHPSPCEPAVLNGPDDQATAETGAACLLAEYAAGRPVVWDVLVPTVEGEPIVTRYEFDGTAVTITTDYSFDTFGSGGVTKQRCTAIRPSGSLPEGVGCTTSSGQGFQPDTVLTASTTG